jgi:hypothetical protein
MPFISSVRGNYSAVGRGQGAAVAPPLYAFTDATFTSGGKTGVDGPSLTEARDGLTGTGVGAWKNDTSFFTTSNGYQLWTVPVSATYTIQARGASTETSGGGRPALVQANIALVGGTKIWIVVGQKRVDENFGTGGGTFVALSNNGTIPESTPLIVAGGSGCSTYFSSEPNFQTGGRAFADAQLTEGINPNFLNSSPTIPATPTTGQGGTVANAGAPGFGQGGAGWNGNGLGTPGSSESNVLLPQSFFNGLRGGSTALQGGAFGGAGSRTGGFGTGGGGGYTGGCYVGDATLSLRRSTGGSCFVSGTNTSLSLATAGDTGFVSIVRI